MIDLRTPIGARVRHVRSGDIGTTVELPYDPTEHILRDELLYPGERRGRYWVGVRFGPGHDRPELDPEDGPVWGYERIGDGPTCRLVPGRYGQNCPLEDLELAKA